MSYRDLPSKTASVGTVSASATSKTIVAANDNRKGLIIENTNGTDALFIKFGETATVTDYSVQIATGGIYTMNANIYSGVIDGIWAGATSGPACVTEY